MKQTVLIISEEKDASSSEDLKKKLEGYNFKVIITTNRSEGLQFLKDQKINMAVINKKFKKFKSWKLARDIKKEDRYLPVVYVTASEEEKKENLPEAEKELMDKYTDGTIDKPFIHKIVYAKLAKILRVGNRLRDLKKVKDFSVAKISLTAGVLIVVLTALFIFTANTVGQAAVTEYALVNLVDVYPSLHVILFIQVLLFIVALVAGCLVFYRSIDTRVSSIENLVIDILQSR